MISLCKAWLDITNQRIISVNNALRTGLLLNDGNGIVMLSAVRKHTESV